MRLTGTPREDGAAAVEFALLLPVLMLFLFGVMQYGYGFFQMQSFGAVLNQVSRGASTGVADCAAFEQLLGTAISQNGLGPGDVETAELEWLTPQGAVTTTPQRALGQVRITATFRPLDLGLPFVPFPSSFTRSSTASIQSVLSDALTGCVAAPGEG